MAVARRVLESVGHPELFRPQEAEQEGVVVARQGERRVRLLKLAAQLCDGRQAIFVGLVELLRCGQARWR